MTEAITEDRPEYDYQRLRGRAISLARRWGFGEESEDFGSYAVLSRFSGSKASLDHIWIEYLRLKYGRKDSPLYEQRRAFVDAQRWAGSHDDALCAPPNLWDQYPFEIEDLIRMDDPLHQTIAVMAVVHEMTHVEIAEVIDLSPNRVGQIIQRDIAPVVGKRMIEG